MPPGWRPLTFKYESVCGADCGGPAVQPGERGFWNADTKEVRHASCPPSADTNAGRERSPWTGLPAPRDDWQRLVAYCRACVLRESLVEPPRFEDFGTMWAVVPAGAEDILAGISRSLLVSGSLGVVVGGPARTGISGSVPSAGTGGATASRGRPPRDPRPAASRQTSPDAAAVPELAAEAETAHQELAYGWPLVVCRDGAGAVRCAPLLIASVAPPAVSAQHLTVDVDSAQLNIAVADPRFQPDGDPTVLRMIAVEPLPLGDPRALAERLTIAVEAGLTVREPLDASALAGGRPPGEPGVYNRAVLLRRESTGMTLNLRADLRDLFFARRTEWPQTAAAWLVRGRAATESRPLPVVSTNPLNGSQASAVLTALSSPVSVVTGPPGTGKSQFVAALVTTARDQNLTVLVASTNNGAVDEAVKRASAAHPATILRTGNATYRKELVVALDAICNEAAQAADRDGARGSHHAATVRRDHARDALGARAEELRHLDATACNVSRLNEALWTGHPPADARYDPARVRRRAVRARRWWRWRARRKLLGDLSLGARGSAAEILDDLTAWAHATLELQDAHERFDATASNAEWAQWDHTDEVWQQSGRALVAATGQAAVHDAGERLDGLLAAYREDDGKQGRALLDFLDVLPAWGTSTLSVRSSFACAPAIFDLLIIDEASQCTLPAVLPLAFRAKQIVIVGDPSQLPPVVTLPSDELEQLPICVGLDARELRERHQFYGVDSCYSAFRDLVDDELLLDEHYRCHPDIAGFCNDQFYAGRLHVLTNTTKDNPPPVTGLSWLQVAGSVSPGKPGSRVNEAEADAIVDWVSGHAPALLAAGNDLGIVTPFAAQARLLQAKLRQTLDHRAWKALRLRVGTAHTFQGGERDVMLFGTVVAPGVPAGTIGWLEQNRYLVNVAVSRARLALVVFGDARHLNRLGTPTLAALHDHTQARSHHETQLSDAETTLLACLPNDIDVRVGGRVADYPVRVNVQTTSGTTLVVAVDAGQADATERLRELTIDQNMTAAGAQVLRIPAWLCRYDPAAGAQGILAAPRSSAS